MSQAVFFLLMALLTAFGLGVVLGMFLGRWRDPASWRAESGGQGGAPFITDAFGKKWRRADD